MLLLEATDVDVGATRKAWQRFVEHGELEACVRPHVGALLTQEASLVSAARPSPLAVSRAAGRERHAAVDAELVRSQRSRVAAAGERALPGMLGDRHGRVLEIVGDEASVSGPEAVPAPGSLLSEAVGGANGIGSALAQGGYVELVGPEHFIEGFDRWSAQRRLG